MHNTTTLPPTTAGLTDCSTDDLEDQITELAGNLNAANYRWLTLIAEFDRRLGCAARTIAWSIPGRSLSSPPLTAVGVSSIGTVVRTRVPIDRTLRRMPPMIYAACMTHATSRLLRVRR
jgi:hypothetical protein